MAFIQCPHCQKTISDLAPHCPFCEQKAEGRAKAEPPPKVASPQGRNKIKLVIVLAIGGGFLVFALIVLTLFFVFGRTRIPKSHGLELGPPISLPANLPTMPDLTLETEEVRKKVNLAKNYFSDQPINTYFISRNLLENKTLIIGESVRQWSRQAADAIEPFVLYQLKQDINLAVKTNDPHLCTVAAMTLANALYGDYGGRFSGEELEKVLSGEEAGDTRALDAFVNMAALKEKAIAREEGIVDVWQVAELSAERRNHYQDSMTSVSSKHDMELLRVRAKVKNISPVPSPVYAPWSHGRLTGEMYFRGAEADEGRSGRYISEVLVFLLAKDGSLFPPVYTPNDCSAIVGGMGITLRFFNHIMKEKALIDFTTGSFVKQNETFDLEVIFQIPQGSGPYRLFLIGAAPGNIYN